MTISTIQLYGQQVPALTGLPVLPDENGFAGMFAGVSGGKLFCMGGANFPEKMPWQEGKKKWYDNIYMLEDGKKWVKLSQRLTQPIAYGVSVSYQDAIFLIGGCNRDQHFNRVVSYKWTGKSLEYQEHPPLPITMAYMAGTLIKDKIIVAGGMEIPEGAALRRCFVLDLQNLQQEWTEIDPWPGPERVLPVCASSENDFYLFSGETTVTNRVGTKLPLILQDAYRLTIDTTDKNDPYKWQPLSSMPKGVAAAATPLPVLKDGRFFFWGGVDALSRLHEDPATFPGIPDDILLYDPVKDAWSFFKKETAFPARVTLPVVFWKDQWIFISGEVRPGVRTKMITALKR